MNKWSSRIPLLLVAIGSFSCGAINSAANRAAEGLVDDALGRGECKKDSDCKGERYCDQGKCMGGKTASAQQHEPPATRSAAGTPQSASVHHAPEPATPPPAVPLPTSTVAGCSSDYACKGERICEQSVCVDASMLSELPEEDF